MPAPFIDPAHIRAASHGGGFERGVAYAAQGAVRSVTWNPTSSTIDSVVAGSGAHPYACRVTLDLRRTAQPIIATACTCPMLVGCKHVVATLLASNRLARDAAVDSSWRSVLAPPSVGPDSRPPIPLALGVELRQRVRRNASHWAPTRVEAATARGLHHFGADVLVGLRPLERSTRSAAWIKGSVSWEILRRPNVAYESAHARWFADLYSIGREIRALGAFSDVSEWLTLDDISSNLLWPHLTNAAEHGIPVVTTKRTATVTIAATASIAIRAVPAGAGLEVSPSVTIDGAETDAAFVRPIGNTGLYRFALHRERIDLTLAEVRLPDPVPALLAAGNAVEIPAHDTAEFIAQHLPRIVRRIAVDAPGVQIPPPVRPTLVMSVTFFPSHRLEYDLQWRYGRGQSARPFAGAVADPDADADAENEIRARIEAVWAERSPVAFAPAAALTGIDAAEFATHVLPALEADGDVAVEMSGTRPRYRELTATPEITVSTVESTDPDWFDLGVIVTIDGRTIPFAPLFTALTQRRTKLLLSDGRYFSLAHPALQRLRELVDEAAELSEWETGPRLSRYQTGLWADFEDVADESFPAVTWRATAEGLRDVERIDATPIPAGLRAELRPYQKTGFDWLAFLRRHRLGGILADDMGLGKTIQMLALISSAREQGERRPFLVVAPTSVTTTWQDEAARFTPGLRVQRVDATRAKRTASVADIAADADVIVTSYAVLRLSADEFASVEWAVAVLDEAQFVKNAQTKQYRAVQGLHAEVTFAITGTPLENSLTDLWSLLSLTAPGLFASARRFRDEYVGPIEKGKVPENAEGGPYRAARLARLRRRIRPLMLRRTKELVASDLPPKQEQIQHIELGPAHRALYDTVLQRERQKVLGLLEDLDRNRFIVFRSLTLLRLLSLMPALVDPAQAGIGSSKLDALSEQLAEIVAEGHRALVFSQFTSFLDHVATRLDAEGIVYVLLDGSTRDRRRVVDAFRAGDAPVFLISLKAGGFGLTLTEADYVFLLDPWWNPAAEAQAVDRAHRIGQTRAVMVYRMIAAGTIEEKVMALQQRKARLFQAVMDDDALFGQALSADDIRGLFDA